LHFDSIVRKEISLLPSADVPFLLFQNLLSYKCTYIVFGHRLLWCHFLPFWPPFLTGFSRSADSYALI